MPLSEEELRLLDQMERALVEEDPKFASTLRGTTLRHSARRRAIIAGFVFAIGITLLFVGVLTEWYVGIAGFVLMLGSATLALGAMRSRQAAGSDPRVTAHPSGLSSIDGGRRQRRVRGRGAARGNQGTFMERMENRWRRRREGGGFKRRNLSRRGRAHVHGVRDPREVGFKRHHAVLGQAGEPPCHVGERSASVARRRRRVERERLALA